MTHMDRTCGQPQAAEVKSRLSYAKAHLKEVLASAGVDGEEEQRATR